MNIISGFLSHKELSDIDRLTIEIDDKTFEIDENKRPGMNNRSLCKSVEDKYYERGKILNDELKELNLRYKDIVTKKLNTFPVNKPCTISYIADYMGIKKECVVWDVLITSSLEDRNGKLLQECIYGDLYSAHINVITESEMLVNVTYPHVYSTDLMYKYVIKAPGWRFVASACLDIFYMERFEV